MNKRARAGKASELIVAGELLRNGVDVYAPLVDDQAIDLVARQVRPDGVDYYDIQIKSSKGYNRIVGVHNPESKDARYILVIHYRHDRKPDEFFYLTADQLRTHHLPGSDWGDVVFNKKERMQYATQNLEELSLRIGNGQL